MEGQADKAQLLAEELEGPWCPVPRITYHSMASKPCMAPDLMLAAGQKVALKEGVMSAPTKDPEAGLARGGPVRAFGVEAASRLLRQGPGPDPPALLRVRCGKFSVEEGDIALPDLSVFELRGEAGEGFGPAGQEDDLARFPVEPVNRMKPEPGIAVDLVPEVRIRLDPGLEDGAEIPSLLLLDAQSGRLLHHEPAPVRCEDGNGVRVGCHHKREGQSVNLRILLPSL